MGNSTRDPEKEALWRERVSGWKSSPMTVVEYCKTNSINENTFRAWQKVINRRDQEVRDEARLAQNRRERLAQYRQPKSVFAPVKMVDQASTEVVVREIQLGESRGGGIEVITPRGFILRLPLVADVATICMVMKAMEQVSC